MITVRMIEDFGALKKGERHSLDPERAKFLISNGYAVKDSNQAIDKKAHDNLLAAKLRDSHYK